MATEQHAPVRRRHRPQRRRPGRHQRPRQGDAGLGELLRPHLDSAIDEIAREIRAQVPEYAQPPDSDHGRRMRATIAMSIEHFVGLVAGDVSDRDALTAAYARLGARQARRGGGLHGLQTAIRLSSQVACRRLIDQAYRLGWPRETLALLTDSLFVMLGEVADAAADGYAAARQDMATERERLRGRLRDLLVNDPPTSLEALADLARAAGWDAPRTIGVVALRTPVGGAPRVVPPTVLAAWDDPAPYLVVPDPDGPGQERMLAALLDRHPGVLGPTVPLNEGAVSLRWARRGVALMERGLLPATGVVRCVEHLAALAASSCEELVGPAAARHLGPLLHLPPRRRRTMAETLLAYLDSGDNAVAAGRALHVHPQTVRYRIRVVQELYGGDPWGAGSRLDLMIALHAFLRYADQAPSGHSPG
ncbi:helix-turn-helix domain-containing protein [Actinomadura keratinilytica]|uniref:PucR family transcriptional regulator n=1 Tax=Actinomadura keratinilytica TaxID=547461 RepID=A0ABP7Z367_9ACTN